MVAFLSSRRSSVNVVIVVVQHVSLVGVAVVVVFVVVRLGSWPILCLGPGILTSHPPAGATAPSAIRAKISLIHQLARRPQVQ